MRAGDRRRREHLCRCILRPPVAQEALELLEELAALVPRPRAHLLLYHGAFAARGCWRAATATAARSAATAHPASAAGAESTRAEGAPPDPPASPAGAPPASPRAPPDGEGYVRPRHVAWAELLRRTFSLDVLACPDCGGRRRLVATLADARVVARILAHLGLPAASHPWLDSTLPRPPAAGPHPTNVRRSAGDSRSDTLQLCQLARS